MSSAADIIALSYEMDATREWIRSLAYKRSKENKKCFALVMMIVILIIVEYRSFKISLE